MRNLSFDFTGGKGNAVVLDVETQYLSDEVRGVDYQISTVRYFGDPKVISTITSNGSVVPMGYR